MSKKIIRKGDINEEVKPNGLTNLEKAQKETKKESDAYYKDVQKKVDSVYGKKTKSEINPKKFEYSDAEKKTHDEFETMNGLEMLEYDSEPNETFKDRAKKAITGDSTMGNAIHVGKHNPETGEGNGNTEPVWGASNVEFGDNLIKRAQNAKKAKDSGKTNYLSLGDDMELKNGHTGKGKQLAFENVNEGAFDSFLNDYFNSDPVEQGREEIGAELAEEELFFEHTHFAVKDGKIVEGFNLKGLNKNEIVSQLDQLVMNPIKKYLGESVTKQDIKLYTSRGLAKIGLDESIQEDWATKQPIEETQAQPYDSSYTHFLIHKETGTVVEGFDYAGYDVDDIKASIKEDFANNDFGLKMKDVKLMSKKACEKAGVVLDQANSYYIYSQKNLNEGKIKRLKFKSPFNGVKKAMCLIPESYKLDGKKFEMTDGNETYLVRWEGSINEGVAVVLQEENKTVISESLNRMKHLMAFNGLTEHKITDQDRLFESEMFELNLIKAKKNLNESKVNEKGIIAESASSQSKPKFKVQKLDFNTIAERNAEITKAKYICEGKNYLGVEYQIKLKNSSLPNGILAEQISETNKYSKPSDRTIAFRYFDESGNELNELYKSYE